MGAVYEKILEKAEGEPNGFHRVDSQATDGAHDRSSGESGPRDSLWQHAGLPPYCQVQLEYLVGVRWGRGDKYVVDYFHLVYKSPWIRVITCAC